jgi:hypothetical protein
VQSTPQPRNASGGWFMNGVSCASMTACLAVGPNDRQVGMQWDGREWAGVPQASGPSGTLYAASCVAPSACTAVGAQVAEHWDGTRRTAEYTPFPTDGGDSLLYGVSCISAAWCIAVGTDYHSASDPVPVRALSELWNGSTWTELNLPLPAGTTASILKAVSCASETACTAVGGYAVGGSQPNRGLVEAWDGTRWDIADSAQPLGAATSILNGVSCLTATACTAVGVTDGKPFVESSS